MSFMQLDVDSTNEAKGNLLRLLAEGKPYVFLTVTNGTDEAGEYVETGLVSDMPPEIIQAALSVALQELEEEVVQQA